MKITMQFVLQFVSQHLHAPLQCVASSREGEVVSFWLPSVVSECAK